MSAKRQQSHARARDEAAAVWLEPSKLKPWPENPRDNESAVARVAESIKRFGFGAPIVARAANREIIAGHTRWRAAKQLKMPRVPVRLLDLSERDAHVLALRDNRDTELTKWSDDLGSVLQSLPLADVNFAGWTTDEYKRLSARLEMPRQDEDETPGAPKVPTTKPGDVWTLGRHTLMCGDGQQANLPADAVLTDPPYGISVVNTAGNIRSEHSTKGFRPQAKSGTYSPIAGDEQAPDVRWLLTRAKSVIIWGGNYFADQLPPSSGWLVWDKRADSGIENDFASGELAWSNRTGSLRIHKQLWNGMIREGEKDKRVHPTQKPVALMQWCLGFSEGTVFDPFLGSGTTLIAAERLGRACIGAELSPVYCDVIVERWERLTGEKAKRS